MISLVQVLPIGNAIRVFAEPEPNATRWKLLRKLANTFTGYNDPDAEVILDSNVDKVAVDTAKLTNGTAYYYALFCLVAAAWALSGAVVAATPAASYADRSVDALTVVRDRLDAGLQVEVARQVLVNKNGKIAVMTAPPVFEDTTFPAVSVHMTTENPVERGIGEILAPDLYDLTSDQWGEFEGYLANTQLTITGWALNPDERITLRKALRRIIVANFGVFDAAGLVNIETSFADTEEFDRYSAPVYMTVCTFTCKAPIVVSAQVGAIDDIEVVASMAS